MAHDLAQALVAAEAKSQWDGERVDNQEKVYARKVVPCAKAVANLERMQASRPLAPPRKPVPLVLEAELGSYPDRIDT